MLLKKAEDHIAEALNFTKRLNGGLIAGKHYTSAYYIYKDCNNLRAIECLEWAKIEYLNDGRSLLFAKTCQLLASHTDDDSLAIKNYSLAREYYGYENETKLAMSCLKEGAYLLAKTNVKQAIKALNTVKNYHASFKNITDECVEVFYNVGVLNLSLYRMNEVEQLLKENSYRNYHGYELLRGFYVRFRAGDLFDLELRREAVF